MLDNIDTWRIICLFISYPIAFISAYLCLVHQKEKIRIIWNTLYWVLAAGLIVIVVGNQEISIFQVILIPFLWATAGPLGCIVYFIRKRLIKPKKE
jgi:hypothetical protein